LPSGTEVTGAEIDVFSDALSSGQSDISHWLVLEPGSDMHKQILEHLKSERNLIDLHDFDVEISEDQLAPSALKKIAKKFKFLKRG
jgi:hypothetical protein